MKHYYSTHILFLSILCMGNLRVWGQESDSLRNIQLNEVTVTAYQETGFRETSFNLSPVHIDSLSRLGNFNLTDLLAKTPGVSMLGTGVAISKPVIRGLYGNRILILLSGLKFDNQQWQEEHGLGLSELGLARAEVVKGPMSVLYGTEAIGGIVNLVEEHKAPYLERESDASVKFNTNTLGGTVQFGTKANYGKRWYRLRAAVENHADYSDGNSERVLNSRFQGYYVKGTYGFERNNWISENNFASSFNKFGFIFSDVYTFLDPDGRWSRSLSENPAHLVLLNTFSSENRLSLRNGSRLNINFGVQSNERMEKEGGGAVSLNMHLLTIQYLLKWEKQISARSTLILSHLGSFEDNTNYGARKIVPDARMEESNLSAYLKTEIRQGLIVENGIGIGEKWIKTFFTPLLNGPEKEIQPFSKFEPYYNAFTGLSYNPTSNFNFKFNVATGVRIPNLAELASDGLHEGVFTYEIGLPSARNEQNFALNMGVDIQHSSWAISVSPFYNYFINYVYLAPTTETFFGFPVYRFRQQDARQYGAEALVALDPLKDLHLQVTWSGMISKTVDGNYTPFVPAQKIEPEAGYTVPLQGTNGLDLWVNAEYNLAQDNVYPDEIATPDYLVINAGIATNFSSRNAEYQLSAAANNLLNDAYFDHLSRFKYFGLLNIGRNVVLTMKVTLQSELTKR